MAASPVFAARRDRLVSICVDYNQGKTGYIVHCVALSPMHVLEVQIVLSHVSVVVSRVCVLTLHLLAA